MPEKLINLYIEALCAECGGRFCFLKPARGPSPTLCPKCGSPEACLDRHVAKRNGRRVSLATRRALVRTLLEDGLWHSTAEICAPSIGGSEGTRRLRELRKLGLPVEMRKKTGTDMYEYRVMSEQLPLV